MDTSSPSPASSRPASSLEAATLVPRKPMEDDAKFDITAMVDLVFMMNIYFLVCWITSALAEVNLPPARHGRAIDTDTAVVVTIIGEKGKPPLVYLGERKAGAEILPGDLNTKISTAVAEGQKDGKSVVLIKAESIVRFKDVSRVASAAAQVKGMKLHLAVMEKD
jgi:biopolymer transport protein ExbD